MIWTKLKKLSEDLLATSLQSRVEYHLTRYGSGVSAFMTRGWITFDGHEIVSCSTIKHIRKSYYLTGKWYSDEKSTLDELQRQGIFTRQEYVAALSEYIRSPVQSALQSVNPITRAIVLLNRRIGKRTLRQMTFPEDELQIVKDFYCIRCQAEVLYKSLKDTRRFEGHPGVIS